MSVTQSHADSALTAEEFAEVRRLLDREAAIQVNDGQEYLIEMRLLPVIRRFELDSLATLVDRLDGDPVLLAATVDAMTTNETLFFRDSHPFHTIRDSILPGLVEEGRDRPITIWCAACSSGQEPYSLGMMLVERFPELVAAGRVRIIATDISRAMIARCKEGRYSQFEVERGLSPERLNRHFVRDGHDWIIRAELRSMIRFFPHNLIGPWSEIPRCDIVLMRNVLIYFTTEVKSRVLTRVRTEIMRPGGVLLLGSSETTIRIDATLQREEHDHTVLYRSP